VYAGTRTLRLNLNRLMRDDVVFGVTIFGQDITERKRAEEAVRESEAKYRRLYERMMDGYVVAGMDGTILRFNDSYRDMTGYSSDELRRLTYRDIILEAWHDIEERIIEEQVLIRGYSEIYEKEYRKKDGSAIPVELRTFLLKAELGSSVGSWAIVRDITSRKLAELEARKLREELAHVTRVSTLGELTSALAHEISQPLAAILSNAQAAQRFLSRDKPDMLEIADILGDIIRDDIRAAEVIRKIRSLLKKEEICYESLSLNDVIEEILSVVCNDSALAGVSIVTELDPALPSIWGDRIQLQQVILNLILNAAEAMKEERPDVHRLILRTSKHDDGFAKVSIRDLGPGIKEDNVSRLFDPFYTTKGEGMGMGLAISKEIIKSHQSAIWVENNPDKGAVFPFTVPFDSGARQGNAQSITEPGEKRVDSSQAP
jgi:two-component system, LuxR family, sensor kinase FixL